jgi:selenide,water dikinase
VLPHQHPDVLVDASTSDDAAVYRLNAAQALTVTADFFTPIVDDAYDYGRIAAANALSDVYAMGARPLFALNLVAFPRRLLDEGILDRILEGGAAVARDAGIVIIGGHSIDDPEPKYGLCVVGEVTPDALLRNSTARPGDRLVLTKPIGTGLIATALKNDAADAAAVEAAVTSMVTLNAGAADAMRIAGASACTDVTGYGLIGHLHEMVQQSGVAANLHAGAVPLLPTALQLAEAGHVPAGSKRNREDTADSVHWDADVPEALRTTLCDAQTSGGLLIAVPPARLEMLLDVLLEQGAPAAAVIGEVTDGAPGEIRVQP